MFKVDLHTHSSASPDGSLTARDYQRLLAPGQLDYIAVTDHDRIDFAEDLQSQLGDCIIVGEEITTTEGEIVGLYLTEAIPAGLNAAETVQHIKKQGGLVYIPHPFETVRSGISAAALETIASDVDIVETCNGRAIQNRSNQASKWAATHNVAGAASSDAHGIRGWGKTYSIIAEPPTAKTLVNLLSSATYSTRSVGVIGRLYPKLNRIRRRVHA